MPARPAHGIIWAMAGTTDDTRTTKGKAPAAKPVAAPPKPAPAPAAERLSVIWLRDTKDKPAPK